MALLYPKEQIKSIRPVNFSRSELEEAQNTNAWNWTCLMGWHDDPKIPPWEEQKDPLQSDIRKYRLVGDDADVSFKPAKNNDFHDFMDNMVKLMKELNEDAQIDPEVVVLQKRLNKQKHMASNVHRFVYDERVAFVKTFGEHLQRQQAEAARALTANYLGEDEVIVNGKVYDHETLLSELLYQMVMDDAIVAAMEADDLRIDVDNPLGEDTALIRHQLREKHAIDQKAESVETKHGIDALQLAARANRMELIKSMPLEFRQQQDAAAKAAGFTLEPDQIVIGGWVYTWEHGIEEIIDALQNDEAARTALNGFTFQVGNVDVGFF